METTASIKKPSKINSLIGFAVKSGKIIYGLDKIVESFKTKLIIYCASVSDNSFEKIHDLGQTKIKTVKSIKPLCDIVYKQNCKVIAITDSQFASAILKNLDDDFVLTLKAN